MKPMLKFQKKLFVTYSVLVIFILVLFIGVGIWMLYTRYSKEMEEGQRQITLKTQQQADTTLYELDKMVGSLIFNKEFRDIMKRGELQRSFYTEYNKAVLSIFVTLDAPKFQTYRLIAFNDYAYYTFVKSGEDKAYITDAIKAYPWKEQLHQLGGSRLIIPPHYDTFSSVHTLVYSVARNLTDGRNEVYCTIEAQYDYQKLADLCQIDEQVGEMIMLDATGALIYPLVQTGKNVNVNCAELWKQIQAAGASSGRVYDQGRTAFYQISDYSGWITLLLPTDQWFKNMVGNLLALSVLVFVILCAFMLYALHRSLQTLTKPLAELNRSIRDVSLDHMALKVSEMKELDEIGFINRSFEKMFAQLEQSIALSVQAKANEERANYLALEAQMNPHTIYNTIAMIESVSYVNGDREVSALCLHFSRMLRYVSDYTRKEYFIRDEVAHLNNYAVLTQKRFEGKLVMNCTCDEKLLDVSIPKFTLQPLAENAVKHGFTSQNLPFVVSVQIKSVSNGWRVTVQDNGVGFEQNKLAEIAAQFAACDESLSNGAEIINNHIGNLALNNIYVRFRIQYGSRFSCQITNNENGLGCTVALCVTDLATTEAK